MTKEELTKKFKSLYDYMSVSNEPKYMMLFGDVMCDMMADAINNSTAKAEEWIDRLEAVCWKQYLTKNEASTAVKAMIPTAPWDFETWHKAMTDLSLECEREGIFNKYALWAVMNQVYTDNAETIAKVLNTPLAQIPAQTIVPIMHEMALNLLVDKDGRYDVRHYLLGK